MDKVDDVGDVSSTFQVNQDTRHVSVQKNGSLIETFVSKNINIHPSQPKSPTDELKGLRNEAAM